MEQNNNNQPAKDFIDKHQRTIRITAFILVGFFLGLHVAGGVEPETVYVDKPVVKEVEVERVVHKTPDACVEVLDIDAKIFVKVAEAIDSDYWEGVNGYLSDSLIDKRTDLYVECIGSN